MADMYQQMGYGARQVGFGHWPAIAVVDFQTAFTDPQYPLGGSPLVLRALENTARLLAVARRHHIPIASCYTAYTGERDTYWKIPTVVEQFRHGHPCTELDPGFMILRCRRAQERTVDLFPNPCGALFH